jgi:predicted Zn-dependent protease
MLATFAYTAARAGKIKLADDILNKLLRQSEQKYVSSYDIAMIYIGMGQNKTALKWLDKAFKEKAYLMVYLMVDPVLDPLRDMEKFKKILKKMNFPE